MTLQRAAASSCNQAPARQVYAIIADYRGGYPCILPKPYFVSLSVEQGGKGAGTVISFQLRILGGTKTFHAAITEPEPGRVLVATNLDSGVVTTFTVDPRENGQGAQVTITTDLKVREGVLGTLESWITAKLLRPVFMTELRLLAAVSAKRAV